MSNNTYFSEKINTEFVTATLSWATNQGGVAK
jgi:hypothetical protein